MTNKGHIIDCIKRQIIDESADTSGQQYLSKEKAISDFNKDKQDYHMGKLIFHKNRFHDLENEGKHDKADMHVHAANFHALAHKSHRLGHEDKNAMTNHANNVSDIVNYREKQHDLVARNTNRDLEQHYNHVMNRFDTPEHNLNAKLHNEKHTEFKSKGKKHIAAIHKMISNMNTHAHKLIEKDPNNKTHKILSNTAHALTRQHLHTDKNSKNMRDGIKYFHDTFFKKVKELKHG